MTLLPFDSALTGSEHFDVAGDMLAECLSCGVKGFEAISVSMSQRMNEGLTVNVACNRCDTTEQIIYFPTGEVKSTVQKTTWKQRKEQEDTAKGVVTCVCGAESPALQMVMIAHRCDDGAEYLLDRCASCAKKPLCPSTPNGVHGEVLHVVFGDEEYAGEWTFNPMPEKQSYGICKTCRANLYWIWTEGCKGEYREMTWSVLADHWAADVRDRVGDEVLAFSMDSSCEISWVDSWCDTHRGWHC